ncbi:MAG: type VI secretion system membrane subunit TssM [Gammaproteobacteria bacterium]
MSEKTLDVCLKQMWAFLSTTSLKRSKKKKLSELPLFLILGQSEAGKTTFLKHSDHGFILAKKQSLKEEIAPSNQPQWWATNEAVYLDIPGKYILTDEKKELPSQWRTFHRWLQKHQKRLSIQGVIVVCDLPDMLSRSEISARLRFEQIAKAIQTLNINPLPIHIAFNKCDLIPGFNEFFSDLDKEERQQAWGFELKDQTLEEAFGKLISRINSQLITKLHHEHDESKRLLIKSFPIQLEALKSHTISICLDFIKQIQTHSCAYAHGIYFTSAKQAEEFLEVSRNKSVVRHGDEVIARKAIARKSFFVHALLNLAINVGAATFNEAINKKLSKTKRLWVVACASVFSLTVGYFSYLFMDNFAIVSQTERAILHFQTSNKNQPSMLETVRMLSELDQAKTRLQSSHIWMTPKARNTLTKEVDRAYQEGLTSQLLPATKTYLEQYLQQKNLNAKDTYIALTTYLMLVEPSHFDEAFIQTKSAGIFKNVEAEPFILKALINEKKTIAPNQHIIANAREALNQLSPAKLALVLIDAHMDAFPKIDVQAILGENSPITVDPKYRYISPMYTQKAFESIDSSLIQEASSETMHGNWVLGKHSLINDSMTQASLMNTLTTSYHQAYIKTWLNVLNHLKLTKLDSFETMNKELNVLASTQSPILKLIDLVNTNTNIAGINSEDMQRLRNFAGLLENAETPDKSVLYQSFIALKALSQNAMHIATSQDVQAQAFQVLREAASPSNSSPLNQIDMLAVSAPEPLKSWLETISEKFSQLAAPMAADYVNRRWKKEILQPYMKNFHNRYPFSAKSHDTVDLDAFTAFFSQNGALENFKNYYLTPFVSNDDGGWKIKPQYANHLSIPNIILIELKRFAIIQQMYFGHDGSHPYISFHFDNLHFSPDTKEMNIVIGDNVYAFPSNTPVNMSWPSASQSQTVKVTLTDALGKESSRVYSGPWGVMRFVNAFGKHANKLTTSMIDMSLNIENAQVRATLAYEGDYNPFDDTFIQHTWMPRWVFKMNA